MRKTEDHSRKFGSPFFLPLPLSPVPVATIDTFPPLFIHIGKSNLELLASKRLSKALYLGEKHKLESRLLGETSITSDMQMTPPLWQKVKRNKRAS